MYEIFYGFRENPFRLTPDPEYLFLSPNHQEALGHLLFGVNEGNGVVVVTGEIGTGKTTLLRTLVRDLSPTTTLAYIFNPALSSLELLQTINTDLGLPGTSPSKKELIDILNCFLLDQRRAGKRVVVIIDEAQDLEPAVLEQLRLLSNLETEREKLLQILLVGQPELGAMLAQPALAQLEQRITLRWHLGPLSAKDTAAYVQHRVRIATENREPLLFTPGSLRAIHRATGGVPRLINVLCHRTLLVGYTQERKQIDRTVVRQAAKELRRDKRSLSPATQYRRYAARVGVGGVLLIASILFVLPLGRLGPGRPGAADPSQPPQPVASSAETSGKNPIFLGFFTFWSQLWSGLWPGSEELAASGTPPAPLTPAHSSAPLPAPEHTASRRAADSAFSEAQPISDELFLQALQQSDMVDSAVHATSGLLQIWGAEDVTEGEWRTGTLALEAIAHARRLEHLAFSGSLRLLTLLDLPIVVEIMLPEQHEMRFVLLLGLTEERCLVLLDRAYEISRQVLTDNWFGKGHLFWRDFERLGALLAVGQRGEDVGRLHSLLAKADVLSLTEALKENSGNEFSPETEAAVASFQKNNRLTPDGVVGPLTMILLYNAIPEYDHPRLSRTNIQLGRLRLAQPQQVFASSARQAPSLSALEHS